MSEYATDWRAVGACRSADPDLFFPISDAPATERQIRKAQRICAACAVRQQCLDFAMRTGETHGIWGGTTPDERLRARRARTERRRRHARRSWLETPQTRASLSASHLPYGAGLLVSRFPTRMRRPPVPLMPHPRQRHSSPAHTAGHMSIARFLSAPFGWTNHPKKDVEVVKK
jgi:WhiB family redox-sensing transcriptional regulator